VRLALSQASNFEHHIASFVISRRKTMKLVRYGNPGKEKPGLIDANGKLRDLSGVIKDIGPEQLGDAALPSCASSRPTSCRWSKARRATAARSPACPSSSPSA
jgi:hypothetical protein